MTSVLFTERTVVNTSDTRGRNARSALSRIVVGGLRSYALYVSRYLRFVQHAHTNHGVLPFMHTSMLGFSGFVYHLVCPTTHLATSC
mgnify:CR=1 FL=1